MPRIKVAKAKGSRRREPPVDKARALALTARGKSPGEIATVLGCSPRAVRRVLGR